jgi:hypothetical protein
MLKEELKSSDSSEFKEVIDTLFINRCTKCYDKTNIEELDTYCGLCEDCADLDRNPMPNCGG